jgi:hypothetical protein
LAEVALSALLRESVVVRDNSWEVISNQLIEPLMKLLGGLPALLAF